MKRILKAIARRGWAFLSPIRRPFARKVSALLTRSASMALREEVHPRLDAAVRQSDEIRRQFLRDREEGVRSAAETALLLDGLMREVTRLQDQVEALQGLILETREERTSPARLGPISDAAHAA